MKQTLKIITTLIIFLSFYGCGQSGEKTKAKLTFDTSFLNVSDSLGGVYFFGKNEDTKEDFALVDNAIPNQLELSNGRWTFLAVAWNGSSDPAKKMEGSIKCAKALSNLNGTETTINMTLQNINCRDAVFGPAQARNASKDLLPAKFHKCGDNALDCLNSTPLSMKLILKQKRLDGSLSDGLVTRCLSDSVNASTPQIDGIYTLSSFLNMIPTDYSKYRIIYYSDASCSTQSYNFEFSKDPQYSLNKVDPNTNWALENDGTAAHFKTFVPICQTPEGQNAAAPHTTAAGKIICNKDQFTYINSNPTLDYKFLSDIDLEGNTYSTSLVPTALSGNIDGNGHKIYNATLNGSSLTTSFGIFSTFSGAGTIVKNLSVQDINLISPTSAGYPSGALVGRIDGGVSLESIKAENISITAVGSSKVGAIAGWYSYTGSMPKMANIGSVKNINIEAQTQCTNIGGAFGLLTGTTITHFENLNASNVTITLASCTGASTLEVGGVIGSLSVNGTISNIIADNVKIKMLSAGSGASNSIGGIIGREYSNDPSRQIKDMYISNSEIGTAGYPLIEVSKVGGVLGSSDSASGHLDNILAKAVDIYVIPGASAPSAIGGIIGRGNTPIFNTLFLGNINAAAANDVGGIIGAKEEQTITSSKSFGTMTCNSTCGGIVGKQLTQAGALQQLYSAMNISSTSGNTIGGIIGHAVETPIDEVAFEGSISGTNDLGGIVGKFQINNIATFNLTNLYTNAIITDTDSGDSVALGVANVSGGVTGTLSIQKAYFLGKRSDLSLINKAINSVSIALISSNPNIAINGNTDGLTSFGGYSVKSDMANISGTFLTSLPIQWIQNTTTNFYELAFVYKLKKLDALSKHASMFDPIFINTPTKWNNISDDLYFMDKTLLLTSNLDFDSMTFNPIGSETNPFTGAFLGNGKYIKNINFPGQGVTPYIGVFGSIGPGAKINDEKSILSELLSSNHLTILNSFFEPQNGQSLGILAGKVNDVTDPIVIKNITIHGDNNSATSEIDTNGSSSVNIGGAIGLLQLYEPLSIIENIKVKNLNISADSAGSSDIGGVIGSFDGSSNTLFSKLFFSGSITGDSMTSAGGVFGHINPNGTSITLSQLTSVGEITTSTSADIGGIYGLSGPGSISIVSSRVNMNLIGDSTVGCVGATGSASMDLGHIYAICPTLTGTTVYPLLQSGFSNNAKTLFSYNTIGDSSNIQAPSLSDFTSYSLIQILIGEDPWPEFVYEPGKYPYLPFEKEI